MKRAAIYARFSSDRQRDRSIDDQVRLCRDHAAGLGWPVVEVFADHALSGAHAASRPALQRLLAEARAGRVDVVVAEALDRLSRDQEDVAALYKRMAFAGVAIVTVAEGEVGPLHIGLKGTMNALFLDDLAKKIRRGQAGRVHAGRSAGGLGYGYAVERRIGADGELERGLLRVDPDQAAVVRRIVADYVAGRSPRAIAAALNREGVPGPRGGAWTASAINGSRARGTGILHNEAYAGRRVWNRVRMVRDPETGKRLSRPNPPEDWVVEDAPELRIVDEDLWRRAQSRRAAASHHPPHVQRRPRRLLSGLLRCGQCGGSYTLVKPGVYGCSARRERGTCDNPRMVGAERIEAAVLAGIKAELLQPGWVDLFCRQMREEARRLRQARSGARQALEVARERTEARIARLVEAIAEAGHSPALIERLAALEAECDALDRKLGDAGGDTGGRGDNVVDIHPNLGEAYRRRVERLGEALADDPDARAEAAPLVRALIGEVTIEPGPKRGQVWATVQAAPAGLLALLQDQQPPEAGMIKVVAEERLSRYPLSRVLVA